ncbi:calcium-binding protein [Salipiger sp. 1_MG-2023]|uniref:calcium-binding protein n=1 Tax=Salipiger sp. 1_MG-2023 TaxID=3062665 RepID=UPI0026E2B4AB|nr:calcium-binding protein [Salipiger sp. 1_MG-2023]MDO6584307.1 calcium-binding protein [Salipiger sp. 1_MG-2023]
MAYTITTSLDALLELSSGIDLSAIAAVSLEHEDALFDLIDLEADLVLTTISSTRLVGTYGPYAMTLTGAGIGPVDSAAALLNAIETGTADGSYDSLRISLAGTEILAIEVDGDGAVITTGDVVLAIDAALPLTFAAAEDVVLAIDLLLADAQGQPVSSDAVLAAQALLSTYSVSRLALSEAGVELAQIDMSEDGIAITLAGYTLAVDGPDLSNLDSLALLAFYSEDLSDIGITGAALLRDGVMLASATGDLSTGPGELLVDGMVFDQFLADLPIVGLEQDTLFETDPTGGAAVVLGFGGADTILGSTAGDALFGGDQGDEIMAGAGNDTVFGGNGEDLVMLGNGADLFIDNGQISFGDDTVFGNGGNDTLLGGGGNDDLRGQRGNDVVSGGIGDDVLRGNEGFDTLRGGAGDDTVIAGDGRDLVFMGGGDDLFADNGQGGAIGSDTVYANAGNDTIGGGAGNDVFFGQDGADLIYGRLGNDRLFGGNQNDTMLGGDGNDTIAGGNGADRSFGGSGNDIWFDNAQVAFGNDYAVGGNGNDTFYAGGGDDTLVGGAGADVFDFSSATGSDEIDDYQLGIDSFVVTSDDWTSRSVFLIASDDGLGGMVTSVGFEFSGSDRILFWGIEDSAALETDVVLV